MALGGVHQKLREPLFTYIAGNRDRAMPIPIEFRRKFIQFLATTCGEDDARTFGDEQASDSLLPGP